MIYSAKIVQMSEKTSSSLECFSECSLSYEKIVQASGMTKQNTLFFLTSSLRHPKIFIKEFGDFLMPCHQHCLSVYILVQR